MSLLPPDLPGPPDFWALMLELESLNLPEKMPLRLTRLRKAIPWASQLRRQYEKGRAGELFDSMWAKLQMDLGIALAQSQQGDRPAQLEEAIAALKMAEIIYTEESYPPLWAMLQHNLGGAYKDRLRGKRAENIEIAIGYYEAAKRVYTRKRHPFDWACVQIALGDIYFRRIRGVKSANLEHARLCCQQALEEIQSREHPHEWAQAQDMLGVVLLYRINGERAKNIDTAIDHFHNALDVWEKPGSALYKAQAHSHLGTAFRERRAGQKEANLGQAISHFEITESVWTRDTLPVNWAEVQSGLGLIYIQRNRRGDIEQAISVFKAAQSVYTRDSYPLEWANAEGNLGMAYRLRTEGVRHDNLNTAIAYYESALGVFTPDAFPIDHRNTQLNIAWIAYEDLATECEAKHDPAGITSAYQRADGALKAAQMVQRELAWHTSSTQERILLQGERANLREMYALHAWCLWHLGDLRGAVVALEAGRAQAMAESLVIAGTTLEGVCQTHKAQFEKAQAEWQTAIAHSREMETQALFRVPQRTSEEHQRAREQQQAAYEELQRTRVVFSNIRTALRACHACNRPDFLPDEPTYQEIADAAAPEQALLYLEATRKGGAAFLLPPKQQHPYGNTREPIVIPLPLLTTPTVNSWIALRDEEFVHQGGYGLALQGDGLFLLSYWAAFVGDTDVQEQRLATPVRNLPEIIPATMVTLRAIVEDMVSAWSQVAESPAHDLPHKQEQARMYHDWLATPLKEALSHSDISRTMGHDLRRLLLHRELQQLPHTLGERFMAQLRTGLDAHNLQDPDQAIALIPCGRLNVLPLNVAWVRFNAQSQEDIFFQETCILTYQASARSLAVARQRAKSLLLEGPLLAVGDPTSALPPLPGARLEAKTCVAIARKQKNREDSISMLGAHATLAQFNAKLQEIRDKRPGTLVLLAAHGYVDPGNPRNCYMQLAGNEQERLTLMHLQQSHLLEGVRLFIASGCVTGQGDFRTAPDEMSSFAAGVLEAGAAGVLATQWSVDDYAAFLLSVRFTQLLLDNLERSPAWAIREAARWLRTLTLAELHMMRRATSSPLSREISTEDISALAGVRYGDTMRGAPAPDLLDTERLTMGDVVRNLTPLFAEEEHPFSHPFFWAPVIIYGA